MMCLLVLVQIHLLCNYWGPSKPLNLVSLELIWSRQTWAWWQVFKFFARACRDTLDKCQWAQKSGPVGFESRTGWLNFFFFFKCQTCLPVSTWILISMVTLLCWFAGSVFPFLEISETSHKLIQVTWLWVVSFYQKSSFMDVSLVCVIGLGMTFEMLYS